MTTPNAFPFDNTPLNNRLCLGGPYDRQVIGKQGHEIRLAHGAYVEETANGQAIWRWVPFT